MKNLESYKKFIFAGITLIALGVTFSTSLKDAAGSLGIVLIALGGLFFIVGMHQKKTSDEKNK